MGISLNVRGPIHDPGGYAEITRSLTVQLHRLGVSISLQRHPWDFVRTALDEETQVLLDSMLSVVRNDGPVLHIGVPDDFRREPDCFSIGLTMLETDRICAHWVKICNQMDEIWVPSTFNQQTFVSSGVEADRLKVMPLGVDPQRFHPEAPPLPLSQKRGFAFLANFEWSLRKGYDLLIRAFVSEFSREEEVCLILKTYRNDPGFDPRGEAIQKEVDQLVERTRKTGSPPIIIIGEILSMDSMPSLYTAADCYILPTRGEGWNLPVMEAMAAGLPVITTGWSAPMDFLSEANSYLIPIQGLEPLPPIERWKDRIYAGSCWARPSLKETRRWMRHVFVNRQEAKGKGMRARADVLTGFTWEISAQRMLDRLRKIKMGL
ncbi:MAG: glycosyltransferase [Firmicutes bacterium]|nr:glycosyltransferase [Bacillota bacterium]MCL5040829.1 glycosyltransferase [Bacillota bacterium]